MSCEPDTYARCPRCNGEWNRQGLYDRCTCGMSCAFEWGELHISFGADTNLYWDGISPTHDCTLYVSINGKTQYGVDLPWLPFTITREELAKYLLLV